MSREETKKKLAAMGIARTSGTHPRDLILKALRNAGPSGLTIEEMAQAGGNQSDKGAEGIKASVQSAISHLRRAHEIVNLGDARYVWAGGEIDGQWVEADWVK